MSSEDQDQHCTQAQETAYLHLVVLCLSPPSWTSPPKISQHQSTCVDEALKRKAKPILPHLPSQSLCLVLLLGGEFLYR